MRAALFALAFTLFGTTLAFGRIGETAAELDQRWGRPYRITNYSLAGSPCQERIYTRKELTVKATLWKGVSHREIFVRDREWHDFEVQQVMNNNVIHGPWEYVSRGRNRMTFTQADRLWATYNIRRDSTFFTISTSGLARAEAVRNREEWYWRY